MKKSIFTIALIAISLVSFAQVPAYYNDVNLDLSGQDLLNELADKITNTHTTFLSYTPGVWDACKAADVNPNNSSEVLLIYGYNDTDSDITNDRTRGINDNGGNTDDWNREHVFPRSLASPDLGTTGAGADAHNLRPSDPARNSSRSNRKFADGSGNSGITSSGHWYPGDEWKGDVARMMMFMYLRYDNRCLPSAVGVGNILSNDSNMIDLFLAWNVEDPVSSFEQQRNEAIANIQGNRNPFVDNPVFATYIWGGTQAEDLFGTGGSTGGTSASLLISEYVEGSSYNKAIEVANISGSSVNLSDYSLKKQTNGAGTWSSSALNLSGTLSSGNVHVVASAYGSSTLTSIADQTSTSSVMTFNGNDAIGLFYNDTLIDIVGVFNGGSSNVFGANKTLVRDTNASASTTYNSSEWTSYSSNTYDYLGSYSGSSSGGGSTTVSATLNITFDQYSSETSWEILNSSGTTVYSGNGYSNYGNGSSIAINMDLNAGCYTLRFYDSYGDGICCSYGSGFYYLTANGSTLASGGSFGSVDTSSFCLSSSAKTIANSDIPGETSNTIGITLYPNPTSDYLNITGAEVENVAYSIYDENGSEVKSGTSTNNSIYVANFTVGIYFIKINSYPAIQFIKN